MTGDDSTIKKWSLVCVYLLSFTASASVSVIAPFFPTEAAKKGMSTSTAGYVFSVYGASLIIMNSFIGKILPYIGNKAALAIGIIILGPANVFFGLLENVDNYTQFAVLCFAMRVMESIGAALVTTTVFMTIMKMYADNSAKPIAMNEASVSAGYMVGPVIGSALFAIGGYSMPFIVLGAIVLLNLPFAIFLIKSYKKTRTTETNTNIGDESLGHAIGYMQLISIFDVFFVCLLVLIITINIGSIEATLGIYLESYNIAASSSGLVFFVPSAAYCICSAIVGHFYAKSQSNIYYIIGLSVCAIGFIFIGPFSQIQAIRSIYLVVFSMFLMGAGCAFVIIPTMPSAFRAVRRRGFEENITTCSLVSGLWTTVYSFGYVIGPMFGAVTYEKFGFAIFALLIASINVIAAILCAFIVDSSSEEEEMYEKLCSSNQKCYSSNSSRK